MSEIRRRKPGTLQDANTVNHSSVGPSEYEFRQGVDLDKLIDRPYNLLFSLGSLIVVLVIYVLLSDFGNDCWSCSGTSCNSSFDVIAARSHLVKVTSFGPRTAGSQANEYAAADYLRNELKSIAAVGDDSGLKISFDEHISNYSSFRAFFHVSSYSNLRNFALRFHDSRVHRGNENKSAFLINCHYDTAPGSPGASDAFVNCAVMLEICRILSTGSYTLFNDLVFLFNGAEESLLLSSHAFITQHKWAEDIVAFMNLEGAGAGRRLFLFQTGPGSSSEVLLDAYVKSFTQPFASVFGEDVFQFGLIPSDTDYRIFRDYGLIPGVDLAYVNDGYVYHTPYDTESRISDECLAQSGGNILKFLLSIGNDQRIQNITKLTAINLTSETLRSISSSASQSDMKSVPPLVMTSASKRMVYFDLFGFIVIVAPWWIWKIFNYIMCVCFCFLMFRTRGFSVVSWYGFCVALVLELLTLFLGFGFSAALGLLYHHYGCRMVWYSNHYNILGMFVLPFAWWFVWSQTYLFRIPGGLVFNSLGISKFFLKIWRFNPVINSFLLDIDFLDSSGFLVTVMLFTMSSINATTSYVYTFWLIFTFIFRIFITSRGSLFKSKILQMIVFITFIFVMILHSYSCSLFFESIIPIMGRAGHLIKPDLLISLSVFLMILPVMPLFLGRLQCTSKTASKSLRLMLLNASLSYVILIHASNYGFPYSIQSSSNYSDPLVSPKYKRLALFHTNRYFRHTPDSPDITENESHILVVPLDANGIQYLTPNSYPVSAPASFIIPKEHRTQIDFKGVKELVGAEPMQCNYSQPYCGVASAYPLLHVFKYIYRIPVEFHKAEPAVGLKLLSRTVLKENLTHNHSRWNLTFAVVSGPPHTHVLIRTDGNNTKLSEWSFVSTAKYPSSMPLPPVLKSETHSSKGEHYFLYHLNAAAVGRKGVSWETPWTFWVVFEQSQGVLSQSSFIDVAVSGVYIDEEVSSPALLDFITRLPPWVTVLKGCTVYDHWRFRLS